MAKILIVDDDAKARKLLVDLLEYEGHTVIQCDNGTDGLKAAERENPDLLISDSHMPGMSGKQFVAELRRQTQALRTPFIFYTAAGDEVREIAAAHGVAAVLTKPSPAHVMLAEIAAALNAPLQEPVSVLPERLRARVPAYLASCDEDVAAMELALAAGDLDGVQRVSHNLKGTGAAYGFSHITHLGARLESAAKAGDRADIARQLKDLASHLDAIEATGAGVAAGAAAGARMLRDKDQ